MKKEYYIQGDPARAEEIKAAFEAKGCTLYRLASNCDSEDLIYYSLNGRVRGIKKDNLYLFEAHPGYKELELPVKPNFKVGDWAVDKYVTDCVFQITKILDNSYEITEKDGHVTSCLQCDIEDNSRLWTIQDAKDGDVLVSSEGSIIIYGGEIAVNGLLYDYVALNKYKILRTHEQISVSWVAKDSVKPATKEQRDLLFAKMEKEGYQWDEKKKELKMVPKHYDIANLQPFDKV